jgi:hypothetical protein
MNKGDGKARKSEMQQGGDIHKSVMGALAEQFNFATAVGSALVQQRFDMLMGLVILINCLMIGLEASCHAGTECEANVDKDIFKVTEHIFLSIYIVELFARFYAFGVRNSLASYWVRFDVFLVLSGVLSTWILTPLFQDNTGRSILVLKVLRVVRLARACRLLVQFRDLWILVRGLMGSVMTMMWSVGLIFVLIFV